MSRISDNAAPYETAEYEFEGFKYYWMRGCIMQCKNGEISYYKTLINLEFDDILQSYMFFKSATGKAYGFFFDQYYFGVIVPELELKFQYAGDFPTRFEVSRIKPCKYKLEGVEPNSVIQALEKCLAVFDDGIYVKACDVFYVKLNNVLHASVVDKHRLRVVYNNGAAVEDFVKYPRGLVSTTSGKIADILIPDWYDTKLDLDSKHVDFREFVMRKNDNGTYQKVIMQ